MKIATLVLIIRRNAVLFGFKRESFGRGKLNAPGGKLEGGETIIECAVREARDEVGVEVDPAQLEEVAIITFHAENVPLQEVHVFRTESFVGEPHDTESMEDLYWYPIDDLHEFGSDMHASDMKWMPQAVRGKIKFRASVFYDRPGEGFRDIKFFPFVG